MAIANREVRAGGRIPGPVCTAAYLFGMVLVYVGERLLGGAGSSRLLLDGLGTASLLWAVGARAVDWAGSWGDRRAVEGRILVGYVVGIAALLLYALQVDPVRRAIVAWLGIPGFPARLRVVLEVLWPIVWVSAVLPVLFMEVSYASMARAPRIERRRVSFSAAAGLSVAWLLVALCLLNYVGSVLDRKWDLSFQRPSSPSESACRMVSNLNEPFEVFLFYPEANEVRELLSAYFEELASHSDFFRVRCLDQVLEPKLAKDLGVRRNGTVVYRYRDGKEVDRFGLKLREARSRLARLDGDFQGRFLRLVAEKRIAYFTTGHGERPYDWNSADDPRSPVKGLKTILEKQHFEVKRLGLGQGLASAVPDDAALVLVMDPSGDFLPEELDAIRRYLARGGRIWIVLDPERSTNAATLLADYGLRFVPTLLANERYFVRVSYTEADRYDLFSNRFSAHPSVTTLNRNASRLAVLLLGSGYLEKTGKKEEKDGKGRRIVMTLRSMPGTWADGNGNHRLDPPGEEKKTYHLAAAVSFGAPSAGKEAGGKEMRMLVLADGDALSDKVLGNLGNYFLFEDGLKWFFPEEKFLGSTTHTEKDVRIVHTKEQDVFWFYGTVFGVPLLVLAVGIGYNRFRMGRSRRRKKG